MKKPFFWKLCGLVALGAVLLFLIVNILTKQTELHMSFISEKHQQELIHYGAIAEQLYLGQDEQALALWLQELQQKENTWAAVVSSDIQPLAGSYLSSQFKHGFRLGRHVEWKIHLYFKDNPIMDIPFNDSATHFLIQLPQRMRPGDYYPYAQLFLQVALPLMLLTLLCWLLYSHVMRPLKRLEGATRQFSEGNFNVRIKDRLGVKESEFTALADAFDQMADRTSELIDNQRQLLSDLSHELRTPLARLDMAIDCVERRIHPAEALERLRHETILMNRLVEDTLTLAWLTNEKPKLETDDFDLVELLQVICDDAKFEYSQHVLSVNLPDQAVINNSSQRALGQAFENIIRNALKHSALGDQVIVSLVADPSHFIITVKDNGPGVPDHLLSSIFQPFFQVNQSRTDSKHESRGLGGFGLGLALARRQVDAVGGTMDANNHIQDEAVAGLIMTVKLPRKQ